MADRILSVITSVYKTAPFLESFYQQISQAAQQITHDYELIFVIDGSPDNAVIILERLCKSDPRITVIELSRNFGQHAALWTGIQHASSEYIFYIDSDLEEKPEWLGMYMQCLKRENVEIVFGVQAHRTQKRFLYNLAANLFYRLLHTVSEVEFKRDIVSARLMTRHYLQALLLHHERHIELSVLCHLTGFKQAVLVVDKNYKGNSGYGFCRLGRLFNDYLVSATLVPLYLVSAAGALGSILLGIISVPWALYGLFTGNMHGVIKGLEGGVAALLMLGMSIMSIYIAAIMKEVRARPVAIIKRIYGNNG